MAHPNEASEVIGHYLVPAHGRPAQPLLHESTSLFQDVVSDKLSTVESAVEADADKLNQFFLILHWASDVKGASGPGGEPAAESGDVGAAVGKASVMVKQRTLLMIAAHAGSLRVLAYLLARGAEPSRKSPDGLSAYDMAVAGESSQAATAIAMMKDADSHPSSSTRSSSTTETHSYSGTDALRSNSRQLSQGCAPDMADADGSIYSTTDLTRPEYSTDDFRMFNFKVLRCSKRHAHDWRACPFAHPTENARRRDPREFKYCALACPDYKQGFCIRGDVCPYAHGVFECWLHPSRYRTQLCKDGANCHRPVCFFAHSLPELRAPTYTWVPGPADLTRPAMSLASVSGGAAATGLPASAAAMVFNSGSTGGGGANGSSPVAPVEAEARALLSHSSSGIPALGSGSDANSVGAPASCGSPRAGTGNGSSATNSGSSSAALTNGNGGNSSTGSMVALMMASGGGVGGASAASALMGGGGGVGNVGSHGIGSSAGSSSGNLGSPSPSGSGSSKEGGVGGGGGSGHGMSGKGSPAPSSGTGSSNGNGQTYSGGGGGGGKLGNLNLTQPNAAAGMLGFTAPRMSNAFARRHGLNPKDNPMLNLQKIALQTHQQPMPNGTSGGSGVAGGFQATDNATGGAFRNHGGVNGGGGVTLQVAGGSRGGGINNTGAGGYNGAGGGHRLHASAAVAAAAAAATGAASQGFGSMPLGGPGGAGVFGVSPMQMHLPMHAAAHLGGNPTDPSLLAAQLAALNLQQQQQVQQQRQQQVQQHLGIGMGINMTSGAAAAAAAAAAATMGAAGIGHGPMPYMAGSPHPALIHAGMYGPGAAGGMYDHTQQHLIAAMGGGQAEV
ncbi:hypothetical protein GPECTOR_63g59 [Gonium pectorale]|uniref:C3H1-type domain-containing protein n=1 Tax=Gonium pectorale TaxID=33097 RepID=A0A150G4I2_GONPE|nr:hypothetical protein GPECTOR_63g59 [Gonium pectorale]|eukprot:KXZ44734.1 hypothetical protein GPECTOR_63g59 [Gonium pectorale]